MIKYKTEKVESKVLVSVTCDVCKKEFFYESVQERMEIEEFHYIRFTGGYGSIFGDGASISCDICQHCLKEKLGEYLEEREYLEEQWED